jgi:hypothetical protein
MPRASAPLSASRSSFTPVRSNSARHGASTSALHGAGTDTNLAGDLEDAFTGAQLSLDTFFNSCADPWPAERFARFYGPLKASIDTLADHAAQTRFKAPQTFPLDFDVRGRWALFHRDPKRIVGVLRVRKREAYR